jgi:NADH:ubiquinone oxidoreductase subunit 5 (subunit L)/multisubunit Na+/H+ antiporter MnhA subunit
LSFNFSGIVLVVSAIFTSFYSAKLVYYVFIAKPSIGLGIHKENSETFYVFQYAPLILLSVMSIFSGYLLKDLLAGYGFQSTLNYFSEYSLDNTKVV